MESTYNSIYLFFSSLNFSLSFFYFSFPFFVSYFFSFFLLSSKKYSHFLILYQRTKGSSGETETTPWRRQRHLGNGKEATTSLVSFSISLSLCLSLSLVDRSRSLFSLSWRRRRQEVVVIIFADLSDLCPFFLDNEVRNFMDND